MFGFSQQRQQLLAAELRRFAQDARRFGALRAYLVGDFARGRTQPDSELELVIVQETDEPFHRRADFWVNHLRPRVGARFLVYTPAEAEALEAEDPLLLAALGQGEAILD
jgi:hypothetical protein